MGFSDSVKAGFRAVNRNWQLVIIRVLASIVNCLAFFMIVGIPVAAAIVFIGMEIITTDPEAFLLGLKDAFLGGYAAFAAVLLAAALLYAAAATFVWTFVTAGSAGVLAASIARPEARFSTRDFFSNARKFFTPVLLLYALVGLGIMLAILITGLATGGALYLAETMRPALSFFAVLLGAVLALALLALGVLLVLLSLAAGAYGTAIIVFEGEKPWAAIKRAAGFMREHPRGFWGYGLLILAYGAVSFVFLLAGYPFKLIPILGMIIALPYQILAYAVERYLGLALMGTVLDYYRKKTEAPPGTPEEALPPHGPPPGEAPREEAEGLVPPGTPPSEHS